MMNRAFVYCYSKGGKQQHQQHVWLVPAAAILSTLALGASAAVGIVEVSSTPRRGATAGNENRWPPSTTTTTIEAFAPAVMVNKVGGAGGSMVRDTTKMIQVPQETTTTAAGAAKTTTTTTAAATLNQYGFQRNNFPTRLGFVNPTVARCMSNAPVIQDDNDDDDDDELSLLTAEDKDSVGYYYKRIIPPPRFVQQSHVLLGALSGEGKVQSYRAYRRVYTDANGDSTTSSSEGREVAVVSIQLGNQLNGHPGIVHGGVISLLFDDAMGFGIAALELEQEEKATSSLSTRMPMVVTANLSVDYRYPLVSTPLQHVIVRVHHIKTDGRKIYVAAKMTNATGNILYAEATSLFVAMKQQPPPPNEEEQQGQGSANAGEAQTATKKEV